MAFWSKSLSPTRGNGELGLNWLEEALPREDKDIDFFLITGLVGLERDNVQSGASLFLGVGGIDLFGGGSLGKGSEGGGPFGGEWREGEAFALATRFGEGFAEKH